MLAGSASRSRSTSRPAGLTLAEQQTVEIAKAISLDARVLIMDEPTASLSAHEVQRLFRIVDNLRTQGVAILFISHRMDEVFEIADTVTILRDGQLDLDSPARRADSAHGDPGHGRAQSRRDLPPRATRTRRCAAQGRGLEPRPARSRTSRSRFMRARCSGSPVWSARAEPMSGWRSSGSRRRQERSRSMAAGQGRESAPGDGSRHRLQHRGPAPARTGPAALDRHEHHPALAPRFLENSGWSNATKKRDAETYRKLLEDPRRSVDIPTSSLSGGNQQKVVISKWLETNPKVLILDEPPAGSTSAPRSKSISWSTSCRPGHGDHADQFRPARGARNERPHPGDARRAANGRSSNTRDVTQEKALSAAMGQPGDLFPDEAVPSSTDRLRRRGGERRSGELLDEAGAARLDAGLPFDLLASYHAPPPRVNGRGS